jgi:FkbM family methyltransferase
MFRLLRDVLRTARDGTIEAGAERLMRAVYQRRVRRRQPFVATIAGQQVTLHHRGTEADAFAAWQCFYRQQYRLPPPLFEPPHHDRAVTAHYQALVAAGRVPLIVDAGAHIGAASLWFAARYPGSRIVAVEPAEENLAVLRRNAEEAGITVVAAAVGAADGEAQLADTGQSSMGFRVGGEGPTRPVAMLSLPTLLARHAAEAEPFILKIDVEGAERQLFAAGGDETASRFPLIVLEEHDFMLPGQATASGFFRFHAEHGRDFVFANENIFSFDMKRLRPGP